MNSSLWFNDFLRELNSNVSPFEEFFVRNMGIWKAISAAIAAMFWLSVSVVLYFGFSFVEKSSCPFSNPWVMYFFLVMILIPAFSFFLSSILVYLGYEIKNQAEEKRHQEDNEREEIEKGEG